VSLKQHLLVAALAQATRQNTLGAMCAVNDVRRVNGAAPCRKVRFTRSTKAVFSRPLSPSPYSATRYTLSATCQTLWPRWATQYPKWAVSA
jgi:hypothetical protein